MRLAATPELEREAILTSLGQKGAEQLAWDWRFWGRPEQFEPRGDDWSIWMIMAGRGFGKTRSGAEWVRENVCGKTPLTPGRMRRVALVAETAADARDVMVEGPSGVLAVHPPAYRPKYEPSKRRLTWPNGAVATLYSAEDPEQLRGPEHDGAWSDELAKWRFAQETWDMLQFGLRLGDNPRQLVTTTPRPIPLVRWLLGQPYVRVTRGSTFDNAANLAPKFLEQVKDRYEGTRLGRQELNAELLDDVPGAFWTREMLDLARLHYSVRLPDMKRVVIAVDPSGTSGQDDGRGDDVGIVAAGIGTDGLGYVLEDATLNAGPSVWGQRAVNLYDAYAADLIVGERNFGGAMIEHTIRTVSRRVNYRDVVASRGKVVRAEPIAALYEQNKIRHAGTFAKLEDELCYFTREGYMGSGSPNRADALVWALTELFFGKDRTVITTELRA